MLKFEHTSYHPDYPEDTRTVAISTSEDEFITNFVKEFIIFLRALGFYESGIIEALQEGIEEIKDKVKEEWIMLSDDKESEGD